MLILDNRLPPYTDYHEPYRTLKERCGFSGPTLIVSAEIDGLEFSRERRQDHEVVLDKGDIPALVKNGSFAQLLRGEQALANH